MIILRFLAGLGHMTCAVLACGVRGERTDEVVVDIWYNRQAEARLRALGDEQRRYAEAAVAVRLTRVEREAEAVAREAGFR